MGRLSEACIVEKVVKRIGIGELPAIEIKLHSGCLLFPSKASSSNPLNSLWSSSHSWWERDRWSKQIGVNLDFWKSYENILTISKDKRFAVTSDDHTVLLTDISSSKRISVLGKHTGIVMRGLITDDNAIIVTVCNNNQICYWDYHNKVRLGEVLYNPYEVSVADDLRLSHCGRYIGLIKSDGIAVFGLEEVYQRLGSTLKILAKYLDHGCGYLPYDSDNALAEGLFGNSLLKEYTKLIPEIERLDQSSGIGNLALKDFESYRPLVREKYSE